MKVMLHIIIQTKIDDIINVNGNIHRRFTQNEEAMKDTRIMGTLLETNFRRFQNVVKHILPMRRWWKSSLYKGEFAISLFESPSILNSQCSEKMNHWNINDGRKTIRFTPGLLLQITQNNNPAFSMSRDTVSVFESENTQRWYCLNPMTFL
jgi:hypothetical protein